MTAAAPPPADAGPGIGRARLFTTLAIASALFGSTVPSPLYRLYQAQWQFSSTTLTALFAVYAVGVLIALAGFGRLSDRLPDRRYILLPGLAVVLLGSLVFAFADSLQALFLGRLLAGVGTGTLTGSANAALIDFDKQDRQRRAAVIATVAFTGGAAVGPVFSSAALYFELWPTVAPYLANALLATVAGLGLVRADFPRRTPSPPPAGAAPRPRPGLREAMQAGWAMFWLVCGVLVLGWSLGSIFVALGPTMLSGILPGGSLALAGLIVTGFQLAAGTTQFACRRMASTRAVPLGLALMSLAWLGCVLTVHFERPLLFTLSALAAGVGYGASFVGAMNRFTTLTPADHRATLGSLFYIAGYVGSGLAILALGALVDAIDLLPAMWVVAVCLVAGSLGLVLARRRVRPPPLAA